LSCSLDDEEIKEMGVKVLSLVMILMLCSCAVNRESREHYVKGKKMRHGILPQTQLPPGKILVTGKPINRAKAMRGKVLYEKHCLQCHGKRGLGDGPMSADLDPAPANLRQTVRSVPHFTFFVSVSQWIGKMPGWKQAFSRKEISELSHYLRTLGED
jgi:mono/diheme cytochrome c family protein